MLFDHPDLPGRQVRLAYCLNLHPAEDLDGVMDGMRRYTLPLSERLAGPGRVFGVGVWLPASVAIGLTQSYGAGELDAFTGFLCDHDLDAFTFNAFPAGGFHSALVHGSHQLKGDGNARVSEGEITQYGLLQVKCVRSLAFVMKLDIVQFERGQPRGQRHVQGPRLQPGDAPLGGACVLHD